MQFTKLTATLFLLSAMLAGGAVALYRMHNPNHTDALIANGAWKTHNTHKLGEDKLITAQIAVSTLYALRPSEVIYMVAETDSKGGALDASKTYTVKGNRNWLKARYWSITPYAEDYFLVDNKRKIFNYNCFNTTFDSTGNFEIKLSPQEQSGNWIKTKSQGKLYLLLRLYHPEKEVYNHLSQIELPIIEPKIN